MKRAIVLAIVALFAICVAASADSNAVTLQTGSNFITASLVPYDPAPSQVFRTDTGAAITITGNRLSRWDPLATPSPTWKYYSTFGGGAAFGKVLLGAGYFLKVDAGPVIWVYNGVPNGVPDTAGTKTDMWISLPKAGFNAIGCPFTDAAGIVWANCKMTDGNETVSVADAKNIKGWWSGNLQYWDPLGTPAPTFKNIVLSGLGQKNLLAYKGYFLKTSVDNLALIVPHL